MGIASKCIGIRLYMILSTGRPITSLLVGFCTLLLVSKNKGLEFGVFFRILPIILITLMGFIANDVMDVEKDIYAKKDRFITTGRLSVADAFFSIFILILVSVFIEVIYGDNFSFMVLSLAIIGVIMYSPFSHKYPIFKGVWTALLSCSPLIYAQAIVHRSIPCYIYSLVVVFIVGRELLLDVRDYDGDFAYGMKTIPYYLGFKKSVIISWVAMIGANLFFVFFMNNIFSLVFSVLGLIVLTISLFQYQKNSKVSFSLSRLCLFVLSVSVAFYS